MQKQAQSSVIRLWKDLSSEDQLHRRAQTKTFLIRWSSPLHRAAGIPDVLYFLMSDQHSFILHRHHLSNRSAILPPSSMQRSRAHADFRLAQRHTTAARFDKRWQRREKRGFRMLLGRCTALLMQPGIRLLFAFLSPFSHTATLLLALFVHSTVRAPTTRFAGIPSPKACCPSPRKVKA